MDISCNVIRDLLPLYAEDMVSDESKQMVDEHLCGCDECTKELALIKMTTRVPIDVNAKSLKRVGDSIRRRRVLSALAAIMTVLTIGATVVTYLFTPYYLTAEEAIEGVQLREDGGLAIDYARGVIGKAGYGHMDEENWGILCHTTRYDWYMGRKVDARLEGYKEDELKEYIADWFGTEECSQKDWDRMYDIDVDYGTFTTHDGEYWHQYNPATWIPENGEWTHKTSEENHWYIDPSSGDAETLLWDAGKPYPDSILKETTNVYAIVFFGTLMLAAVMCLVSRWMYGIAKELAIRTAILCGSIAFSTAFVTGGHLVTVLLYNWKEMILFQSVFVFLTALLWYQLHSYKKQDQAV